MFCDNARKIKRYKKYEATVDVITCFMWTRHDPRPSALSPTLYPDAQIILDSN